MKKPSWILIIFFEIVLFGCATPAWKKYSMRTSPDYQCIRGGGEGRNNYYVWKCLDDKRIVIWQTSAFFGSLPAKKYESSCESNTEIESKINLDPEQQNCKTKPYWPPELQVTK